MLGMFEASVRMGCATLLVKKKKHLTFDNLYWSPISLKEALHLKHANTEVK